jgi:hypothetical protein
MRKRCRCKEKERKRKKGKLYKGLQGDRKRCYVEESGGKW